MMMIPGKEKTADCEQNASDGPFPNIFSPALLSLIPGATGLLPSQIWNELLPPSLWFLFWISLSRLKNRVTQVWISPKEASRTSAWEATARVSGSQSDYQMQWL